MSSHLKNRNFQRWLQLGTAGTVLAAGVGTAALAYSHYVEPFDIRLERLSVRIANANGRLPKQGLRILQLSDSHFHGGKRSERERKKIAMVRRLTADLEYDLLVHTGDFWHDSEGLDNVLTLLEAVPKPKLGSYGVFGNHDYAHFDMGIAPKRMWHTYNQHSPFRDHTPIRIIRHVLNWIVYFRNTPLDGPPVRSNNAQGLQTVLEDWGMRILHNDSIHLTDLPKTEPMKKVQPLQWRANGHSVHNGQPAAIGAIPVVTAEANDSRADVRAMTGQLDIHLAGIDDWCMGRPNLAKALRRVPTDAPLILLSHNPDVVGDPNLKRADFVISGHTHGGQLVVPLWGPAHTQSAHLARHEVAGYTRRGRTQIYISRGMGEGIPLRFMAHPQITLITVTG